MLGIDEDQFSLKSDEIVVQNITWIKDLDGLRFGPTANHLNSFKLDWSSPVLEVYD